MWCVGVRVQQRDLLLVLVKDELVRQLDEHLVGDCLVVHVHLAVEVRHAADVGRQRRRLLDLSAHGCVRVCRLLVPFFGATAAVHVPEAMWGVPTRATTGPAGAVRCAVATLRAERVASWITDHWIFSAGVVDLNDLEFY